MIGKGTKQKVAKDMAVTNEKGALVGKMERRTQRFHPPFKLLSDVDRNNRVATKISGKKEARLRFN